MTYEKPQITSSSFAIAAIQTGEKRDPRHLEVDLQPGPMQPAYEADE